MIQKILYIIGVVSLIILTFLTIEMLPIIFQTSWQGILLLISVILLLVVELITIIRKELSNGNIIYNICKILITMYFGVLYYKTYSNYTKIAYSDYLSYCQYNYLIVSLLLVLLMGYLFLHQKSIFQHLEISVKSK